MFAVASVGALLVVHLRVALPLAIATGVLIAVAIVANALGRTNPTWVTP